MRETSLAVLPFTFLNAVDEGESLSLGFADTFFRSSSFIYLRTRAALKYASPRGCCPRLLSIERLCDSQTIGPKIFWSYHRIRPS